MHAPGKFDLILSVDCDQVRLEVIVGISRDLAKGHRRADSWVVVRHSDRRCDVIEKTSVAKIVSELAADLGTREEGVFHSAGCAQVGEVDLVEYAPAPGGIVVCRQSYSRLVRCDGSRYKVLITTIIVTKHRAIANV